MKKIVTIIIAFILCLSPAVFFVGCGEEDKFWETSYNNINAFMQNENYNFINNAEDITLSYNNTIKTEISKIESTYSSLKTEYNQILIDSLQVFNKYKGSLQVKPVYLNDKNQKEIKKYFTEFDKQFEVFVDTCDNFISAKNNLNNLVIDNLNGEFSLQKLKDFKRDYYSLILESVNLSETLLSLYTNCYQDYDLTSDTQVASGCEQLANYTISLKLTKAYLFTEFKPFDGVIQQTLVAPTLKQQLDIVLLNTEKQPNANILDNYKTWLNELEIYNNEFNKFYTSIDNFSIKTLVEEYNNDGVKFADENPDKKHYYQTFNNFANVVVSHITTTTSALFSTGD